MLVEANSPAWLAPSDIQRIMGVSESTVAQWFKSGEFAYFRKGRLLKVEPAEFLKFLVTYTVKPRGGGVLAVPTASQDAFWQRLERFVRTITTKENQT